MLVLRRKCVDCMNDQIKKELLRMEIDPKELYPENADRLQKLIVEAVREAVEDATITEEQYSWAFISEDLCLGC